MSMDAMRIGLLQRTELDTDADAECGDSSSPVGSTHGAWLRSADRRFASARAWDNVIPTSLCKTLEADARKIDAATDLRPTFWVGVADTAPPSCSLERFVHDVLRFHSEDAQQCGGDDAVGSPTAATAEEAPTMVSGAEWWVQVRGSDWAKPSINLHFDADEEVPLHDRTSPPSLTSAHLLLRSIYLITPLSPSVRSSGSLVSTCLHTSRP